MSDELPPLPADAKALLQRVAPPEPPAGAEDRVFAKLGASIAAGAAGAAVGATVGASTSAGASAAAGTGTAAAAGIGAKVVIVIAASSVVAGLAGGTMLGRTVLAPEPIVVEKVKTVEKVIEVPAEAPPPPAPAPARAAEPPQKKVHEVDTALARERELVDRARSALMKGDANAALSAIDAHARQFARGRLAEERESLAVQALVLAGRVPDGRARAAEFHRKYPNSLLGPTVDASLPP